MMSDATAFGAGMVDHLRAAEQRNDEVVDQVVERVLATVHAGLRVHVAGTGHSSSLVLETFYRAGGLACVNPITHPGLVPLHGARASTVMERTGELAQGLLAQARPADGEVAVIFSSSGANPVPVELARGMRASGVWIVAVSSLPHLRAAPDRAGPKLDELADVVLDTGVPPGDAAFEVGNMRTAPLSSLTSVFLWNLVLARLVERADREGVDLPLWTSANVDGGDERNAALLEQYGRVIPHL